MVIFDTCNLFKDAFLFCRNRITNDSITKLSVPSCVGPIECEVYSGLASMCVVILILDKNSETTYDGTEYSILIAHSDEFSSSFHCGLCRPSKGFTRLIAATVQCSWTLR